MHVTFDTSAYEFRPWRPEHGPVLRDRMSFDCETTPLDERYPWITPAYVLGAAFDGTRGVFVTREHLDAFLKAHCGMEIVLHNAAFDLEVIQQTASKFPIYDWVDQDRVWDTWLLQKLYVLGTEGHTARGKGQSTLEHCAERYLGVPLPKDLKDRNGRDVRTSYEQWLGRPPQEIPGLYLEYLAKDTVATHQVFDGLDARFRALFKQQASTWGYVSQDWIRAQIRRWGWQTHHIQLKASIVLRTITANGLAVDTKNQHELSQEIESKLAELRANLRESGYSNSNGPGSQKALQEVLKRLERRHPDMPFPRTPTGLFKTDQDSLAELAAVEPFIRDLVDLRTTEKLQGAFLSKLGKRSLHPTFEPLLVTGRTSSFGEINAQNLPRDDRVRSLFVPSPGHVFLDADYKTLELATLSQSILRQFGYSSAMANAINSGQDLHRLVAARVLQKPEGEVTKEERQKAKAINFGKPGGMGDQGLKNYAKTSFGVDLSDMEVAKLSQTWFSLFPEMEHFLIFSEPTTLGEDVAKFFQLTPAGHARHTGDHRFTNHPENIGRETQPHRILGAMCLKTLGDPAPQTRAGDDYSLEDVDYFWTEVQKRAEQLPVKCQESVRTRQASWEFKRQVMNYVGRKSCFTLTGRLRANASFCARHNTVFQGLAADGAKLALWKLWRAGYRIVNFIHDEVLIEIPCDSDLTQHAQNVHDLMIEGMRDVVPDVEIDVEFVVTARWSKNAESLVKPGTVQVWRPPVKPTHGVRQVPAQTKTHAEG